MNDLDKITGANDSLDWYIKNQPIYKQLAIKIEAILKELIELEKISYHAISCRVKEIESFAGKVQRKDYKTPHQDITDLAGIRIVTYVESEIKLISKIIENNFTIDKEKSLDKSSELGIDRVGYKSVHYIAKLKDERLSLPEYSRFKDKYFEIQVRTILQHAWAEIEHDRNYKFSGVLPVEIQRRFKLLAGLLESADREFNSISLGIDEISKEVKIATKKGELDIPINSTSLKEYLNTKFKPLFDAGAENKFIGNERDKVILFELEKFGLKTLQDIENIITDEFIQNQLSTKNTVGSSINGLLIDLMITSDYKKYFEKVWTSDHWGNYNKTSGKLFELYRIPLDELEKEYGVVMTDQ
jgi:ppGpp synthetase/RelA/SpoT-type nucleotidyltranferase